jgi:hypothetical protein
MDALEDRKHEKRTHGGLKELFIPGFLDASHVFFMFFFICFLLFTGKTSMFWTTLWFISHSCRWNGENIRPHVSSRKARPFVKCEPTSRVQVRKVLIFPGPGLYILKLDINW